MKHLPTLLLALGVAACSPQNVPEKKEPAKATALPQFSFRNLSTQTPFAKMDTEVTKDCRNPDETTTSCQLKNRVVAGALAMSSIVIFNEKGLSHFSVTYSPSDFNTVKQSLNSAYGASCKSENEYLQNAFGAQFQNERIMWCFADGWLILSKYNDKIDESSLTFGRKELISDILTSKHAPEKLDPSDL